MWLRVPEHRPWRTHAGSWARARAAQGPSPDLSWCESLPLGPRILPLGSACVMVHVIHPSIVLSLLCPRRRKKKKEKTLRLRHLEPTSLSPLAPSRLPAAGSECLLLVPSCQRSLTTQSLALISVTGKKDKEPFPFWGGGIDTFSTQDQAPSSVGGSAGEKGVVWQHEGGQPS